jgi:hypothetical protein
MGEPLENLYFNWLCAKVVDTRQTLPSQTYWTLLRTLHKTEFVWLLMGDDNRAEEGKELRREFILQADIPDDVEWRTVVGCSMLEMLIAFARRAEFQTDIPVKDWFWEFLKNLEMNEWHDGSGVDPQDIDDLIQRVIWRTYKFNGYGGLFPLDDPHEDQRHVEIWYQFCNYLVDRDMVV